MYKMIQFLLIFVISACATTPIAPTSAPLSNYQDLCEWFNKSLAIRTKRVPAILIVQDVANKYNDVKFDLYNTAMMNDYINALEEYISANGKFIEDWNKLGTHPLANDYWGNELKAVETYNEGYSLSLKGFNEKNAKYIQEGSEIYATGNIASNKAEELMIDLRTKCK